MKIETYKKASDIPEKYLVSLVDAEIECWGSRPFDEYKICSNPECKAIFAIEDIYENIENYKNKENNKKAENFECYCCNSQTEFIYEKNHFLEILKEYVKGQVSRVLLIDDTEKVEGFGVISKTTLEGAINYEFATRPASYNKEELTQFFSKELSSNEINKDKQIIVFHQLYVSKILRKGNISFDMLKKLISINIGYLDIPMILETRYDSDFYPLGRTMLFNDIISDKYGYVIQYLDKYSKLLNFTINNSSFRSREVFLDLLKYKKLLRNRGNINNRKFYI